jgi:hypothetical protein
MLEEISIVIKKSDIEKLGRFLRDDFSYYHNNIIKIVKFYNNKKFIVKNKSLEELMQNYYIKLVEENLNVKKILKIFIFYELKNIE